MIDQAIGDLESEILKVHSELIDTITAELGTSTLVTKKANEFLGLANTMKKRISNTLITLNCGAPYTKRIIWARAVLRNHEDGVIK